MFEFNKMYQHELGINEIMLGESSVNAITNEIVKKAAEQEFDIIKEYALKGFKYVVLKREVIYDANFNATMTVKYHEFNDQLGFDYFTEQGYEIYDLNAIREYLKTL